MRNCKKCYKINCKLVLYFQPEKNNKWMTGFRKYQQIKRILPVSSPNKSNRFRGNNLMLVRLPFNISDLTLLDENGESAVKPRRIAIRFPVLPVISCLPSSFTVTQCTGSWVPKEKNIGKNLNLCCSLTFHVYSFTYLVACIYFFHQNYSRHWPLDPMMYWRIRCCWLRSKSRSHLRVPKLWCCVLRLLYEFDKEIYDALRWLQYRQNSLGFSRSTVTVYEYDLPKRIKKIPWAFNSHLQVKIPSYLFTKI